jgi:AAA15 family ATPase/GTPase
MFKSISIKNFRGIKNLDIDHLNKINIFVGDNATGKTAILDAVFVLINPNNPILPMRTNEFRNIFPYIASSWRTFFYNFDFNNLIELITETDRDKVKVSISPKIGIGQIVPLEKQLVSMSPRIGSGQIVPSEKQLVSVSPIGIGQIVPSEEQLNREIDTTGSAVKSVIGLILDFEFNNTKYSSEIQFGTQPLPTVRIDQNFQERLTGNYFNNKVFANELDIASQFDTVNQEVGKEIIINFIKQFKPQISDMELDSFGKLLVKDTSFDKRIHLNTYGDGMIRGLYILLDILVKKSGITLIDEIENGLHWSKQEIVWKFIHKIVLERNQQLFVTTHSREMVEHLYQAAKKENFLELIQVYRLQKVDDTIKLALYDAEKLEFALTHGEEFR